MVKDKKTPYLRQVVLRLVFFRFLIPLLVVTFMTILGVIYIEERDLGLEQYKEVQAMTHLVSYYLENGEKSLKAVAYIAETTETEDLYTVMKSVWQANGDFDTLYHIDKNNKIDVIVPDEQQYSGLDMSNLPGFRKISEKKEDNISKPFISLRTGEPTVYIIQPISTGGYIAGELSLKLLQQEITKEETVSRNNLSFIVDQSGNLLAHPSIELVNERTNLKNLDILQSNFKGSTSGVYSYNGIKVLGFATIIEKTGWIVVDQVPLSVLLIKHAWAIAVISLLAIFIWIILAWSIKKKLQKCLVTPLEILIKGTNALTIGDFGQSEIFKSIYNTFSELNDLVKNFLFMSDSLQAREKALVKSEELLIQAEKEKNELLEKALVTKDEFITLISHEFKTPINVIYSAVQLIETVYSNKLPNRVRELISSIKQNTFRQIRLSNNLLDITALNSGEYKFCTRNIDIVLLTKIIADSTESYLNQKNIELSFKSNEEHKFINIDDEKYERIILNLLSNAAKFTDYGGRIYIELNVNDELNIMRIEVNDTGIGIPEEKQKLIFENFEQVDRNLSRPAEGTGIGLSLVNLLVNILGGTIELESEKNIGSKFIVTLPIIKVEDNNENEALLDIDDRIINKVKVEFSDIYF